jgi:ubiquinone biosynthesis protein
VFAKHGFGAVIDKLGMITYLKLNKKNITNNEKEKKELSIGERLRLSLEELGPTFVKLGQILSTRADLLPDDIIKELEKLQDTVSFLSFEEVSSQIENEFGKTVEELFFEFDKKPLAAASIAQVHLARLKSKQEVVVKVQRPGIERIIDLDLKILEDLASFIDLKTKYGKLYNFRKTIQEFGITIKKELDFRVEGENAEKFETNFLKNKDVAVPEIFWDFTTSRVLTMEYINGLSLSDLSIVKKEGHDFKLMSKILVESMFNQILKDGFFHADLHPGNIMVLPNNKIVFLDLGMVGVLNEERRKQFLKILVGVTTKNSKIITQALLELNAVPVRSNVKKLESEFNVLRDKYSSIPLEEIKLGEVFGEIFSVAFLYNLRIPSEFTMLSKSLVTMEGLIEKLDPKFNVLEVVEPMTKKLIIKMFSVSDISKTVLESSLDYYTVLKETPSFLVNFLRKFEDDDFVLNHEIKGLDELFNKRNRVLNHISLSIILLGLSIIITGIIIVIGFSPNFNFNIF